MRDGQWIMWIEKWSVHVEECNEMFCLVLKGQTLKICFFVVFPLKLAGCMVSHDKCDKQQQ